MNVAKYGIALYEFDDKELHTPRPKTPQQALDMAREYFDSYFPAEMQSFEGAHFHIGKGYVKKAAFDVHQTTEPLYHCVLLVCTFYTPQVDTLGVLITTAEAIHQNRRATCRERVGPQV